jgi:hypothetical protein
MFFLEILEFLLDYMRHGRMPPQAFITVLRANRWKTNPLLHPLLDMFVAHLESLREEPCMRQRQMTIMDMLSRVLDLMRRTEEESVSKVLPRVEEVFLSIEKRLAQERAVFSEMLRSILNVLDNYSCRGIVQFDKIITHLKRCLLNSPLIVRPLLQAFITAFEAIPDVPCPLLRLEHARSMQLQFIVLMRSINDTSIQQEIPHFEEFLSEQEQAIVRHREAFEATVQAFGYALISYTRGNPERARTYLSILRNFIRICAVEMHPLIQAFINALEALPDIDCEWCQIEHVQGVFRQIIALMRTMSNQIIAAIPLFDDFIHELEVRIERRRVQLSFIMDMVQAMYDYDNDDNDDINNNINNNINNINNINYNIDRIV